MQPVKTKYINRVILPRSTARMKTFSLINLLVVIKYGWEHPRDTPSGEMIPVMSNIITFNVVLRMRTPVKINNVCK